MYNLQIVVNETKIKLLENSDANYKDLVVMTQFNQSYFI